MTHEEEFDNFVGSDDEERDEDICRRCHDWPCRCVRNQLEADEL